MIKNRTNKKIISKHYFVCNTLFSKFKGLMFTANNKQSLIFVFDDESRVSLHMLFVFYPIDVLFLDKNKIVVDRKENFLPFTFYRSKKKCRYVIELPVGKIKNSKTKIRDVISWF